MRDLIDIVESQRVKLGDLVTAKLNDPEADFWLVRKNSVERVGEPVKEFDKEKIGIKVTRTDLLDAKYLFYMMTHLFNQGIWRGVATGTTRLVSIKTGDVLNIAVG
jgi:hypothetical protein